MRTVIQAFTKGQYGSHYLIADDAEIEGLKDTGVHSKRVPAFVLPDRCLQARGLDATMERGFLQGGAADTQSKNEARHDDSRNDNSRTIAVP